MTLLRSERNPILTRKDIPDLPPHFADVTSVFNPGAAKHRGSILLMLRVQTRGRETHLLMAASDDGIDFSMSREPVRFEGIESVPDTIYHVYDPRITWIDGAHYIMFGVDTDDGCRLGVARTEDFASFRFHGLDRQADVRNGVLFPERFGGKYLRLDRPNRIQLPGGPTTGREIFLSSSADLCDWKPLRSVMSGRPHYWDELIGPGPPPIKTPDGWLLVYHGVATHFGGAGVYQAGVVLLDLADPSRVIARGRNNILEPRRPYELTGQVPNVVFPTGLVVDQIDDHGFAQMESRVRLYYGAADTCVALATTTVTELVAACHE